MSDIAISVENVGKLYRLGAIGTSTLKHDLNRWWAKMRGKEDPSLKIDETNDRRQKTDKGFAWALKDISFDVPKGEVLGIIGSNGAGKSTLLKILSQITSPTEGNIKINGHIASLLEVGTGFHPELSGRENIFLNGAILGMSKSEIRSKFEEIVDFAGVERYIDTPVKRYSSGMYVRLAFAVAAHLEPEILIIDEVLAVGDAEFQKKCLGKMKEVSQTDGRTILFVSHNMPSIKSLCTKALWLQHGMVKEIGPTNDVINKYSVGAQQMQLKQSWNHPDEAPGNKWLKIKKIELIPHTINPDEPVDIRTSFTLQFQFWNLVDDSQIHTDFGLYSFAGECIFVVSSSLQAWKKGLVTGECVIPGNLLNNGSYYLSFYIFKDKTNRIFEMLECVSFDLEDYREEVKWAGKWYGVVRPKIPFQLHQAQTVL